MLERASLAALRVPMGCLSNSPRRQRNRLLIRYLCSSLTSLIVLIDLSSQNDIRVLRETVVNSDKWVCVFIDHDRDLGWTSDLTLLRTQKNTQNRPSRVTSQVA